MTDTYLIQISVSTEAKIWNRCLLLPSTPLQTDLEFYYRTLLDFSDAVITVQSTPVSPDFNVSLLPNIGSAPSEFPANDLETTPDETERRAKYATFLQQLCEMEQTRASLKTFKKGAHAPKHSYTTALTEDPLHLIGYARESSGAERRAWVEEVLQELNPDSDTEDCALVPGKPAGTPSVAWILTPTLSLARHMFGSRILLNSEVGAKWESLLGTDLYPDLIVSRRLTSKGWTFANPLSDKLIYSTLEWYIASQDTTLKDGLSPFLLGCEREIAQLFAAFKSVRISNRLLESADESNPQARVYKLLQTLEQQCLESTDANVEVQPISGGIFGKFLNYVFRASEVPREFYAGDEHVANAIERWVKAGFGFKPGCESVVAKWKDLWDAVMRGKPTAVKLNHFLASMDVWDPVLSVGFNGIERAAIAQEWIRIYLDTQLLKDENGRVKSLILYDQIRKWCYRFLPEGLFSSQFATVNIGPVLTKKGIASKKLKDGRFVFGFRFKHLLGTEDEHGGEKVAAESDKLRTENSVIFTEVTQEEEDGTRTKNRTVKQTVIEQKDSGSRIEHFFQASVTQEIFLGDV